MARRTAAEIFTTARAAGLSVAQAVMATAIALAESGGDDRAVGDVGLQNSTWGPSVGLWQIRTLRSATGTGGDRDINALQGDPARQARAMMAISRQGSDWSPWSVYARGSYQQFLGQARQAAGGDPNSPGVVPTSLPGVASATDALGGAVDAAGRLAVKLGAAGLGLVLFGVGLFYAVRGDAATRWGQSKVTAAQHAITGL